MFLNDFTYCLKVEICGLQLDSLIFVLIQCNYFGMVLSLNLRAWNRELCCLSSWGFCYFATSNIFIWRNVWWPECLRGWNSMWAGSFHQRFWVFYQLTTDACWVVSIYFMKLLDVSLTFLLLFQSFRSFLWWRIQSFAHKRLTQRNMLWRALGRLRWEDNHVFFQGKWLSIDFWSFIEEIFFQSYFYHFIVLNIWEFLSRNSN